MRSINHELMLRGEKAALYDLKNHPEMADFLVDLYRADPRLSVVGKVYVEVVDNYRARG